VAEEYAPELFSGITPHQYAVLIEKAKEAGIHISGNRGTASKLGVDVSWTYEPEREELTLQCLHAPFFMSGDQVKAKLSALVTECLAAV
jgi:hypothetical protein